ncbi:mobilization protein (plasmid) [Streptomyces californicus]|uniref:Mobilization protein n=1 Tax=Streptomyces californicus TaxID=67351 RepID=A0ABD7D7N4_9ACTN|nr:MULTISPECIES: mobilization protein [Streptomyces]QRV39041.1 mobilization protein [Streptomyces californicus]QRV52491.1 mobilization protein [Streptomyces californicus]
MMPKKAAEGDTTADLLAYLFGPGDHEEHIDPHLVAAWTPGLPCPARNPDRMTLSDLALLLDAPVEALRGPKPAEHVWHISVRNEPTDRTLSDAEWATVAAEMVHAAGIAPHGDTHACRWVAVRHADDHIHIVATLARQDGRHPRIRGDIPRMHTAARAFETAWGLTPMSPLDRTARRAPVTGEREKAARRGLPEAARESLQRTVREAAARATSTTDFLTRLRDAGLRVREHHDENNTLDGYAVALPGDRADRNTRPVWFSGRALAYDLSLPRVRERFHPPIAPADITRAHTRIRQAATLLARAGRTEGAGDVAALGDLLTIAAATSPATVRDQVRATAAAFEQASRAPGTRTLHGTARAHFKAAARALDHAPRAARGGGAPAVLTLLIALVEAIEAATAWHRAQQHHAQARAAAQAAVLLREAATLTGTPPRASRASRTAPNTVRVTPAAERGPAPATPVTRVPPRPHAGPHPTPGPGPAPGPGRSR